MAQNWRLNECGVILMPRIYKRFKPHGSTYVRKTAYKHGREVVKPIDVEDFEEMVRICLVHRDKYKPTSKQYFKWYRNYIILIIGVNTGCRINTILESTPRDFAGGRVTVTEHKTGKRQQYKLSDDIYKVLKKYIDTYNFTMNEFMFPKDRANRDAIDRSTAWRFIKKLADEAKIEYPIACHSLRKSYGRWIWDQTHDLLLVQQLLQHSSAEETQRYICLEPHDVEKVRGEINHLPNYE